MDSILERRFLDAQEDQNRTSWLKHTEMRTKDCMQTCNLNERMQLIYKKSKNEQLKDCCLFDRELLSQRPSASLAYARGNINTGCGFLSRILMTLFGVLPDCQPSRCFLNFNIDVTPLGALHALQKKCTDDYLEPYCTVDRTNKANIPQASRPSPRWTLSFGPQGLWMERRCWKPWRRCMMGLAEDEGILEAYW